MADRLSLERDSNVARDVRLAMLPHRERVARAGLEDPRAEAEPPDTVGSSFSSLLPIPERQVLVALEDVARKRQPGGRC